MARTTDLPTPRAPSRWQLVHVGGELDLATTAETSAALAQARTGHPDDGIIVDLQGVTFVDCAGLRPLIDTHAELGGHVHLRNPSTAVTRLLDLSGLTGHFTVRSEPDAAPQPAAGPAPTVPGGLAAAPGSLPTQRGCPRVAGRRRRRRAH